MLIDDSPREEKLPLQPGCSQDGLARATIRRGPGSMPIDCGIRTRSSRTVQPPVESDVPEVAGRTADSTIHRVVAAERTRRSAGGRRSITVTIERPHSYRAPRASCRRRVSVKVKPLASAKTTSTPVLRIACSRHHRLESGRSSDGAISNASRRSSSRSSDGAGATAGVSSDFNRCATRRPGNSVQQVGRQRLPIQATTGAEFPAAVCVSDSRCITSDAGPGCGIQLPPEFGTAQASPIHSWIPCRTRPPPICASIESPTSNPIHPVVRRVEAISSSRLGPRRGPDSISPASVSKTLRISSPIGVSSESTAVSRADRKRSHLRDHPASPVACSSSTRRRCVSVLPRSSRDLGVRSRESSGEAR